MRKGLELADLSCRFGDQLALDRVSLSVRPGEFMSILGPSGCGKSTLLRSIAGLTPVHGGTIAIDGKSVGALRPVERGVAFVFQSYALYPHMMCRQNIAAPLMTSELSASERAPVLWRLKPEARRRRTEIDRRVEEIARQLQIGAQLDRRPGALSGGQRQRVALARALIQKPDLFLLDEPLANLDAALRIRTRTDLRDLQKRLGATTLFVTHDQAEAMAISDRIAIIFDGRVEQIGTPDEIYRAPATLRIARFLAQPYLNVISAASLRRLIGDATTEGEIRIAGVPLRELDGVVAFRPEDAGLRSAKRPGLPGLAGRIDHAEHAGAEANLFVELDGGETCVVRIASAQIDDWPPGREVIVHFDLSAARAYDVSDGEVGPGPEKAVA